MSNVFRGLLSIQLLVATLVVMPSEARGQDGPTGQSQQGLVNGQPVDLRFAEEYGLVSLSWISVPATATTPARLTVCSAALLTNDWVLAAAHCFIPANIANPQSVTVTANWNSVQTRNGAQIIRFGNPPNWAPWDIALIRVDTRFSVLGDTDNFKQLIWGDGAYSNLNGYAVEYFGNGINVFARSTPGGDLPSTNDGKLRYGQARIVSVDSARYWYQTPGGAMIAGGDSGGPSFVTLRAGRALTGVHSLCHSTCLPGHNCNTTGWTWISSTPECADAPIQPLWNQISQIIRATRSPEPPGGPEAPTQFTGTFGSTPANYHPAFVYAIPDNGDLLWYRQESNASAWRGPTKVGHGWQNFNDVIPAGGNAYYALGADGSLKWYRHDGFNDGSSQWTGPTEVGRGWRYQKIFAGGEGIVYAIRADGHLIWYQHGGYLDGGGINTWIGPKEAGTGWSQFQDVFSMGQGIIYAVRPDGALQWYRHVGYADGTGAWTGPKTVGNGWQNFKAIVPLGDGVILAVTPDGKMLWYRHKNYYQGTSAVGGLVEKAEWEGPIQIGNGWQGFQKIFGLLPNTPIGPR
jgi:hypothetical protein